jgi:multiple sugar transport system ATP-binding protein
MSEIVLDSVSKTFSASVRAVDDVTLTVADGEFLVLVGPSGCGKSTLLRMIAGLEDIDEGRVLIGGRDMSSVAPRSRDVAMVFQNYALYPHMTVRENLAYGLKIARVPKADALRRVDAVAQMLGLEDLLDRKPGALSGGQRQRTAMGRAIVREPQAFLMDEPLSNLDAKLRVTMRTYLAQLHTRLETTTVYVTHDQTEAMTLGQRVAVMRDGRVQQIDTPQMLYRRPANVFVAAFIGLPSMNLVEARLDGDTIEFGGFRLPLDPRFRPHATTNGTVILGIRAEDLSSDLPSSFNGRPTIEVEVAVAEDLGADMHVIFPVEARRLRGDAAGVVGNTDDDQPTEDPRVQFTARIASNVQLRAGESLRLAVDPTRFYFFDPVTGVRIESG